MAALFALDDTVWTALIATAATVFTGVGVGIKWLIDTWSKARSESQVRGDKARVDSLGEYKSLLDDTRKQLDRYQGVTESQQQVIIKMIQLHANCRAENREQYGFMVMLYGILKGCLGVMAKAGLPCPDVPELPKPPDRSRDDEDIEFLRRTTEHNTQIIKQARNEGTADRG